MPDVSPPPDALRQHIAGSGLTQGEFARLIGYSDAVLSRILTGKRPPTLDQAAKIERQTAGAIPARAWAKLADDETEETT